MKWTFKIENKAKASLILLLLAGVVFFSNYRLKRLSGQVAHSVQTIYEDRLVVQDLIFSYSQIIDVMEGYGYDAIQEAQLVDMRSEIKELHEKYAGTVLTPEEERIFTSFSDKLSHAVSSEAQGGVELMSSMKNDLIRLEEIQMEEAKSEMTSINKVWGHQEMSFYLESTILLILLLIVQSLVMANDGIKRAVATQKFNLN